MAFQGPSWGQKPQPQQRPNELRGDVMVNPDKTSAPAVDTKAAWEAAFVDGTKADRASVPIIMRRVRLLLVVAAVMLLAGIGLIQLPSPFVGAGDSLLILGGVLLFLCYYLWRLAHTRSRGSRIL